MDLTDWQSRLEEHFSALRARRSTEVGEAPIFALEHGLDEQEVTEVAAAVRTHVLTSTVKWEHRLPWVVYAAEFGYLYTGVEYWQTFEERTPGWLVHGDRSWVRRCFHDFHQCYGGAKPTGPFSRFSIICWPITHAILPRDLQRQLTKSLFELRHALTSDVLTTPRRLGELVAGRSWGTTSRFQQLAQEPLLIGQIAAALLLKGEQRASSLILSATLLRIEQDLDREQSARAWMRSARETAQRHIRFQPRVVTGRGADWEDDEDRVRKHTRLGVEPRLMLRPVAEGQWDLVLELPDFAHVPARFPSLREPLVNSRCLVAGSSARPLARGRLMYGPQKILLRQWPPDDQPLLKFERSNTELDYLLNTECFLRPGPTWLFKVASDGLAYELRAAHARANNKYVLLSCNAFAELAPPFVTAVVVQCEGVNGILLDLPETLTPALGDVLNSLGVPKAETIEIWPAGLLPAHWDGDGNAEWLSTENPCVGLRADHHVEAFCLELGSQVLEVEPGQSGEPVFIELPWLGVGQHTLRASARAAGDEPVPEAAVLDIKIREPRVWVPGFGSQSPFLVVVDPSAPTLEQLWEGGAEVEVHGPRARHVACRVSWFHKGDTLPFFEKQLQGLRIPVTSAIWRALIKKQLDERDIQNAYDLAQRCEVFLRVGELGAFTLIVEREEAPLRWAVCRTRQAFCLKAIDDTGGRAATEVRSYDFETPDEGHLLDAAPFCVGTGTEVRCGLYVASAGEEHRAVVVPPEVHTFADLHLDPRLRARRRIPSDIVDLLRLLELWAGARMTGNLFSRTMRRQVLKCVLDQIFCLIGGNRWSEAEKHLEPGSENQAVLAAMLAISPRRDQDGLGSAIAQDVPELAAMVPADRVQRLDQLGRRFLGLSYLRNRGERLNEVTHREATILIKTPPTGLAHPAWLSEFALRLASCPEGLTEWTGEHLEDALGRLLDLPVLARAARFVVLAIQRHGAAESAGSGLFYDGWEWQ